MSEENTNVPAEQNSTLPTTPVSDDVMNEMEESGTSTNFVPTIRCTYGVSKHIGEDGSKPGDLFLDGKNLGPKAKLHALPIFRYQVVAITDDQEAEFVESLVMQQQEGVRFRDRKEYKAFMERNKDHKINDGFDFLCYIPETNQFGVFFATKKLAKRKSAANIAKFCKEGGFVEVSTEKCEWKKFSWYEVNTKPVEGKVELPENTMQVVEVYLNQSTEEEETNPNESTERSSRER